MCLIIPETRTQACGVREMREWCKMRGCVRMPSSAEQPQHSVPLLLARCAALFKSNYSGNSWVCIFNPGERLVSDAPYARGAAFLSTIYKSYIIPSINKRGTAKYWLSGLFFSKSFWSWSDSKHNLFNSFSHRLISCFLGVWKWLVRTEYNFALCFPFID